MSVGSLREKDWGDKVVFFPGKPVAAATRARQLVKTAFSTSPRFFYYKAIRHLYNHKPQGSFPFPQWVHIEVTNRCNMQCVMCPRQQMDHRPLGNMDPKLFARIIGQMRPYRRFIEGVALMGLGEPLLYKHLIPMSQKAKQAGFAHVYTSTNAQSLDARMSERILKEGGFDRLIFSVDGASKKTYEAVRIGGNYERVVSNIETFLKIKRKLGKSRPRTTFQMLIMDRTEAEAEDFLNRWLPKLGPTDDILIKMVDTFGGQVEDYRTSSEFRPNERVACRQLYKDMSISWDGKVTVCCKDVLYRLAVGNAEQSSLVDLWRGSRWQKLRQAHQNGKWDFPPCDNCDEWYL